MQPRREQVYRLPPAAGAATVSAASGHSASIRASDGTRYTFDTAAQTLRPAK